MNDLAQFEDRAMTERVLDLTSAFMESIAANPSMSPAIPDGATLILIPDDDPELAAHNVSLGMHAISAGENVYFLHVQMMDARRDVSATPRSA